ncbi:glycosyltransferase [Candidatus Neomicrothrix sp.]|uniref:glycosyltransferase n=1 Tax=Candidatus Neomicrothrix sp. TaxID=2719034 RepID=UPI001B792127|nr:glycosyltransferase [Candidatus Microthrix sp.]MBP6134057.1 glycosyltransferase [Candidatus Microthrix sp.]MBP7987190.1 glycosyltransferase [Candidatus Microthrix sp.]
MSNDAAEGQTNAMAAAERLRGVAVTVLVPTRNEGDNVERLLGRLSTHFGETGRSYEVLFVDDSDDETPQVVRRAAAAGEPVRMIHRPVGRRDGGLAGALTLGMAQARGRAVIVMDGDLQHPPEVAESMVAPLLDGPAQVTVGSRYAAGGSAEGLEYRWRHWASVGSRWLVQFMFRETRRSSDPGGGLFAIRPEVLANATLAPEGYKMLVEILVRGKWEVLVDVPYRFETRTDGQTKSTLVEGWNMVKHLVRLWWSTRVGWGPEPAQPRTDGLEILDLAAP